MDTSPGNPASSAESNSIGEILAEITHMNTTLHKVASDIAIIKTLEQLWHHVEDQEN